MAKKIAEDTLTKPKAAAKPIAVSKDNIATVRELVVRAGNEAESRGAMDAGDLCKRAVKLIDELFFTPAREEDDAEA